MNSEKSTQTSKASESSVFLTSGILQRKCPCGNYTPAGKECSVHSKGSGISEQQQSTVVNPTMCGVAPMLHQSHSDGARVGESIEKHSLSSILTTPLLTDIDKTLSTPYRNRSSSSLPQVVPTVLEAERKSTAKALEVGEMEPAAQTARLEEQLDEFGLLDGDVTSDVVPHAFANNGRIGRAIVHWAGGGGGVGNQGVGSISLGACRIDTKPPPATGGTAKAWIRLGTGTATVTRSYTGVLIGANGSNYYFTARAATRSDTHEMAHVNSSRGHHNSRISPLERRLATHMGEPNAMSRGATENDARAALNTFINWNPTIRGFRTADTTDNTPMGTVDTNDLASPDFIQDYGARKVGGVNYAHYIDTPPGP